MAGDLRRHRGHYDVNVMFEDVIICDDSAILFWDNIRTRSSIRLTVLLQY